MANNSIKAAFERMWQHVVVHINSKSSVTIKRWEETD